MGVGRPSCVAAVLTGLVLLAGPAAAQEAPGDDPCAIPPAVAGEPAPTPDPMCQSGMPVGDAAAPAPAASPSAVTPDPDTPVSGEPYAGSADDPCAIPSAVPGEPVPTADPMCQSGMPVQDAGSSAGSGEGTASPVEELPFTGPDGRAVLLGSLGAGLLLAGAGLSVMSRRRA